MKPHHFGGNAKFRAVAQVDGMDEDFYSDAYSNGNSGCMKAYAAADSFMVFTCRVTEVRIAGETLGVGLEFAFAAFAPF